MSYIDVPYFISSFSPLELTGALSYGGRPSSSTGSYLQNLIDEESSWIDSFLNAQMDTPVSNPPTVLKSILKYRVYFQLLTDASIPVPQNIVDIISANNGYLSLVQSGKVSLPGVAVDVEEGIGGSYAGPKTNDGSCESDNFMSLENLRGTFL